MGGFVWQWGNLREGVPDGRIKDVGRDLHRNAKDSGGGHCHYSGWRAGGRAGRSGLRAGTGYCTYCCHSAIFQLLQVEIREEMEGRVGRTEVWEKGRVERERGGEQRGGWKASSDIK